MMSDHDVRAVLDGYRRPPAVTRVTANCCRLSRFNVAYQCDVFEQGRVLRLWMGWLLITVMVPRRHV